MNSNHINTKTLNIDKYTDLTIYEDFIKNIVEFPYPAPVSRFLQNTMATVYCSLREDARWKISSFIKSFGGKRKKRSGYSLLKPTDFWTKLSQLFAGQTYEGFPTAILMTHDIDYNICYNHVEHMAKKEKSCGITACYNFLLDVGYSIDKVLLRDIVDMGHEVGLHGVTYDLRLAFRSYDTILARLKDGKNRLEDMLGEEIHGYRNHSLLYSHTLTSAASDAGFHYQSAVYHYGNPDGCKEYFCWPFSYSNNNLWEIPVSLPQDASLFRSADLSDSHALSLMTDTLDLIGNCGGVACINHHPIIVMDHKPYFYELLDNIAARNALVTTPRKLIETMKGRC